MDNNNDFDLYCIEYEFEGNTYSLNIPAYSWEDASARVEALAGAKVTGRIPLGTDG